LFLHRILFKAQKRYLSVLHICNLMEIIKPVEFLLQLDDTSKLLLNETFFAYAQAWNHISQIAYENECYNRVTLHHMTYNDVRAFYDLPSNYAICARDSVVTKYKSKSTPAALEHTHAALDLNPNLYTLILNDNQATLTIATLRKRLKVQIPNTAPNFPLLKYPIKDSQIIRRKQDNFIWRCKILFETDTDNKV